MEAGPWGCTLITLFGLVLVLVHSPRWFLFSNTTTHAIFQVFRPPTGGMMLSVFLGSGTQIVSMVFVTLVFACLGFLSPATRGGLMTSMLVMYVFMGTPAGFVASRMYKMFGGEQWKSNVLLTACFIPGNASAFLVFVTKLRPYFVLESACTYQPMCKCITNRFDFRDFFPSQSPIVVRRKLGSCPVWYSYRPGYNVDVHFGASHFLGCIFGI